MKKRKRKNIMICKFMFMYIVTVLTYIFYNLIKLNLTVLCFQGIHSKSGRSEATNKITEYFKVFCNISYV